MEFGSTHLITSYGQNMSLFSLLTFKQESDMWCESKTY